MREKKRRKLKKYYLHPITVFLLLTILTVIMSGILSMFQMQGTYNVTSQNGTDMTAKLIAVENLFSFSGMRYIISNALKNFISFTPLATLLISLIGISIAESTGFIETFSKKYLKKMPKAQLTFLVLLIATVSSLINGIGYALLIPLIALVYFIIGRNPLLGIVTSFCGVAFGYGVSIFIGSAEISLMDYTKNAAILVDQTTHIPLSSNLYFIFIASILISIIGTIIIEKLIAPKLGKYKRDEEFAKTEQYRIVNIEDEEQKKLEKEKREKKGLRASLITTIILILLYAYMLIPNMPSSGMLLDMNEKIYLNQLFGEKSYFQDSFSFMIAFILMLAGLAYGIKSKSIKNDKELIKNIDDKFSKIGSIILLLFVVSIFLSVFKQSNIGVVITIWLVNLIGILNLSGIPLIIITLLLIAISNLFYTSTAGKWSMFAPVVVPMFMQSNISPQFAQLVMRVGDSMTNGITPILASFAIYIGYLNLYNLNKKRPYTIKKSIKIIMPYFFIISIFWIALVVGWYIIGLPIGPGIYPTI